jgi:putative nucleotidyltransferase with HDIG domain
MKYPRAQITRTMVAYFEEDNRRIDHALQVLHHAENIMPDVPDCDPEIVIAAALLHDVGIKISEERLGYNNGKTQEEFGPPEAARLLSELNFPEDKTEKVCQIIGNHHSASRYDYPELEILKQADRIVNLAERRLDASPIEEDVSL